MANNRKRRLLRRRQRKVIIDWRSLLNAVRVSWKDRGANCRAGNVNIACPWCGNDPSQHLAISESKEAYFCYRDPAHAGRSFISLICKLGNSRNEAIQLLNAHRHKSVALPEQAKPLSSNQLTRAWDRFRVADYNPRAIAYLKQRGFPDPEATAWRYDLRVAVEGVWSNRLLIPFCSPQGELLSWTGRAWRSETNPKYMALQTNDEALIFFPQQDFDSKRVLVLVEGPVDAIKTAQAADRSEFLVAALAGKHLNPAKLNQLRKAALNCDSLLLALDFDVNISTRLRIQSDIAGYLGVRYHAKAALPPGYKDPAELPLEGISPWLIKSLSRLVRRQE